MLTLRSAQRDTDQKSFKGDLPDLGKNFLCENHRIDGYHGCQDARRTPIFREVGGAHGKIYQNCQDENTVCLIFYQ